MGTFEWPGIGYKRKAISCGHYTGIVSSLHLHYRNMERGSADPSFILRI